MFCHCIVIVLSVYCQWIVSVLSLYCQCIVSKKLWTSNESQNNLETIVVTIKVHVSSPDRFINFEVECSQVVSIGTLVGICRNNVFVATSIRGFQFFKEQRLFSHFNLQALNVIFAGEHILMNSCNNQRRHILVGRVRNDYYNLHTVSYLVDIVIIKPIKLHSSVDSVILLLTCGLP